MLETQLLRGDKVRLTATTKDDSATMAQWSEDSIVMRHYSSSPAMPRTPAQIEKLFEQLADKRDEYVFAVRLLVDDRLIGIVNVDGIEWTHRTGGVAIVIGDTADWGQGYGTEAMRLLLRFAFDELNLHRLQLTVFSYNTPAIRLYEKLGFVREGTHREHLLRDGQRYDMYLYGLLRHEWAAQ